ncbi:hypothetical protein BDY24DRAFT_375114 [Mrakia frigida]|uniref:uncharacterized protein n=1 Tax=Mrakia frigida TaxID=29902 RepID=UPI003FCBEF4F
MDLQLDPHRPRLPCRGTLSSRERRTPSSSVLERTVTFPSSEQRRRRTEPHHLLA